MRELSSILLNITLAYIDGNVTIIQNVRKKQNHGVFLNMSNIISGRSRTPANI